MLVVPSWCLLVLLDPAAILPCWLSELRMWKFKAFCLDYWHVLCLHPHNNFYKRYVYVLRSAVMFDLDHFLNLLRYVFWTAHIYQRAPSACWCCCLCWIAALSKSMCLKQTLLHQSCLIERETVVELSSAHWLRETLLRGMQAGWTIDFSEGTRLWLLFCRSTWLSNLALRMILFVSVVCLVGTAEKDEMSWLWLNSFISVRLGMSPHSPFTYCIIYAWACNNSWHRNQFFMNL